MCGCGTVVSIGKAQTINPENFTLSSKQSRTRAVLIKMHISCENLVMKEEVEETNVFTALFVRNKETLQWEKVAQTEIVYNNLSPKFGKTVSSQYYFEETQPMLVNVCDFDSVKLTNTSIGKAEFMLHELVSAEGHMLSLKLKDRGREVGTIHIQGKAAASKFSSNMAIFTVDGSTIKSAKKHFYSLLRSDEGEEFTLVYSSKVVHGYRWKAVKIPSADLFCDDENRPLQIVFYEYSSHGDHKPVAAKEFTFAEIRNDYVWDSPVGPIHFKNVTVESRYSFLDYIFSGCQISLSIAIDFTASNGYPRSKSSLHYFNPKTNPYINAIQSIGRVLQEYDSDKNIPVFGFGAQPLEVNRISHCFSLNGNIFDPEVHTINSVMEIYRKNILKLQFSGPTNFSEIIRYIGDTAEWNVNNGNLHNYFVLLILTDGQITDTNDTIDEIVRCSELPMSIIIVGVGNRDFSSMSLLRSGINPVYSKKYNKYVARDIVQFVPFEKYADDPAKLTRETLEGLPNQLVDYMTMKGISTNAEEDEELEADFYSIRKEKFIEKLKAELGDRMEEDAVKEMLETGFPVEKVDVFIETINSGYKNILCNQ
eukprot:TRINITY_DN7715_c0_g1_i5.p1 TRINITY_DN7715_c0_g1~~TRINITY_DN7715_c0_g1_i5.p1  ORF type:complete len:618 (+),score=175.02 TRINITY_DN7715_c0_g1_i5:73-1854(+)